MSVILQQAPGFGLAYGLDGYQLGDNFELGSTTTLQNASVYLADLYGGSSGVLDGFSGTIGWAIYSDASGKPGALITDGDDSSLTVTQVENGREAYKVDFDFGAGVTLPPGKYWLVIRDGAWGSSSDLVLTGVYRGAGDGIRSVSDTLDGNVSWSTNTLDLAFELSGNSPPSFTSAAGLSADENQISVATLSATDSDSDPLIFSLTGSGADGKFFTISSSGVLTFKSAPDFEAPADKDTDGVYEVEVKVSDGTFDVLKTFQVAVADVNEAPVISSDGGGAKAAVDVAEGSTDVTTVVASDPELTDPVYSISGGADAFLFDIDPDTGALTFKIAPDFENPSDADDGGIYEVVVKASDGSLFDTQTIAVTVTDANEDPVITSDGGGDTADISIRENRTQVTTVTAKDPDGRTPFVFGLGKGGDTDLFTIDAVTGALSFKSAPDFENPTDNGRNNVYQVEVEVSDGNGGFDTQLISVTVTNGNDRPVITSDGGKLRASVDVAENSTAVTKVQAEDVDGSSITYAISGGDDKALFSIDATTGKITFKAAPDFEDPQDKNHDNAYQITVRATDSDGAIDVQYLTINVTDVDGVTITGTENADTVNANKTAAGQPLPTDEEDHILGLGGNDRLSGLGGDDILEGGAGKDVLKGGAGHDHFTYLDVADSSGTGIDRIRDFTQGEDLIDLSDIDADGAGGDFHFLGEAGFDGTAGALRQRTAGTDVFLEGDTDGNGMADLVILLKGAAGLVLTDGDLGL